MSGGKSVSTRRRTIAAEIIGLIIIAVTLLVFFTAVTTRDAISWVGLLFIILAEIIAVSGFILIDNYADRSYGVMVRAGSFTLFLMYFAASAVVSMLYMTSITASLKWLIATHLILIAGTAVILVPLLVAGKTLYEKSRDALQAVAKIRGLEDRLNIMKSDPGNSRYAGLLNQVCEAARYCDCSSYVPADDLITVKADELEQTLLSADAGQTGSRAAGESGTGDTMIEKDKKVKSLSDEILLLFKKRAAEAASLKAGKI